MSIELPLDNHFLDALGRCNYLAKHYIASKKQRHSTHNVSREDAEKPMLIKLATTIFNSSTVISQPKQQDLSSSGTALYTNIELENASFRSSLDLLYADNGRLTLVIILGSYRPRRSELNQLSIAALILEDFGFTINTLQLFCINPNFVRRKNTNSAYAFFRRFDVTKRCASIRHSFSGLTKQLHEASNVTPQPPLDTYCFKPTPCPNFKTCWPDSKNWQVFNLYNMPLNQKIEHYNNRFFSLSKLRTLDSLSIIQRRQLDVEHSQRPYINQDHIRKHIRSLTPTFQCFDIEAAQFIYPLFPGQKPFTAVPFLFSVHESSQTSTASNHKDMFCPPSEHMLLEFTDALLSSINPNQSLVVFDATLEKKLILQLASLFPQKSNALHAIHAAILDIAPLFIQHHIILPGQHGKASMKHILPCLSTETSYSNLDVQSGQDAVSLYKHLAYEADDSPHDTETLLRDYCRLDTQALLDVMRFILSQTS